MPIASSSVLNQLRNTPYTQTRVPFFPEDNWEYGELSFNWESCNGTGILLDLGQNEYDSLSTIHDSNGEYGSLETLGSLTDDFDFIAPNMTDFFGELDCRMLVKFNIPDTTKIRMFMGFADGQINNGIADDCLALTDGFGLVVQEDSNFKIISNDASATSNISSDIATINTDLHKIYIESDNLNSRWGYSFDNSPVTYITSQIPHTALPLFPNFVIQTREDLSKYLSIRTLKVAQKTMVNP